MTDHIEDLILSNLIHDEEYARNVLPYLVEEYFTTREYRTVYNLIRSYFDDYNSLPSSDALGIELDNLSIDNSQFDECEKIVKTISKKPDVEYQWVRNKTEKFCQDRAVYNAIMESIEILEERTDKDKGSITKILEEALSVSFDTNIGHDFLEDFESRYDFYHHVVERIPFDLSLLNKITRDGLPKKTLSLLAAGTGVGKSLMMCHFAAANLMQGKNVLYITLEMAEERIAERIDANLLNIPLNELEQLSKESYVKKVERVRNKTTGKLVIKEYPTASVGAGHFRHLMHELRRKKKFTPDIIYIDYLNICVSTRMKMGANVNSYTLIKSIAEELRGLAVEFNVPLFTATQTNRQGYSNSDVDITDISESFGTGMTADFMIAAISTEELEDMNQIMIKQLKNRFSDPAYYRRFVLGIDKSRMRLYDVEQAEVNTSIDTTTDSGYGKSLPSKNFDSSVFEEWK